MFASKNENIPEVKWAASGRGGGAMIFLSQDFLSCQKVFVLFWIKILCPFSQLIPKCNMPKMTIHHQRQSEFLHHSLKAEKTKLIRKAMFMLPLFQRQRHCRQWRVRGKLNCKEIFDSVSLIMVYICWSSQKWGGRGDLCYATVNNAIIFLIPNYI